MVLLAGWAADLALDNVSVGAEYSKGVAELSAASRVYLHIPRTGGLGVRASAAYVRVWHDAMEAPPPVARCDVSTSLRDAAERYLSEWHFYGTHFFARGRTVKGWRPVKNTATFADDLSDSSTHNSMVKLLSGCQLYAAGCTVGAKDVERLVKLVASGCLRIEPPRDPRVHAQAPWNATSAEWRAARRVNALDDALFKRLAHPKHKVSDTEYM